MRPHAMVRYRHDLVPAMRLPAMCLLTAFFGLRVAGQAIQRWRPIEALPPFPVWQGSPLPYPALLGSQLIILAAMAGACIAAFGNRLRLSAFATRTLRTIGWIYLALAAGRIAVGVSFDGAPTWFHAWIPAALHIDLALFVLLLSRHDRFEMGVSAIATRALPYVWYPAFMALSIGAFAAMLAAGFDPALCAVLPTAAAGFAILALESRFPEREDWRPTRSDLMTDGAFMGLVMVALPRLLAAAALISLAGARHGTAVSGPWPHDAPLALQVVAMVLLVDLARYWLHRGCHRFMPLWRLHEVHHSPDILYVVNVARFHPLEKTLHFTIDTLPFLLLGLSPVVLAAYFVVYSVNGFFQHSNVRLRYGWLNYVMGTAETHRWHHARDPRLAACNFGSTIVVWDVLFGTWRRPGPVGDIGIPDRHYPKGFLAQMAAPFVNVAIALRMRLVCAAAEWRLAPVLRDPMRAQRGVLARIVEANRDTEFGRRHGFDRIDGHADFARSVPVAEFESLRPFIDAEIELNALGLTQEAPARYVRTSGTTGIPKDIPLTDSHLRALRAVHRDSVAFQFRNCPEAFEGGIFVLVSPAHEGDLANGKPFGSASGIVAGNTPALVRGKFIVPPEVMTVDDSRLKYLLALRLAIARPDLTYAGSANPSTFLALMKLYREHHAALIEDVRQGTFFLAGRLPPAVMHAVAGRLRADPTRAAQLQCLHERLDRVRFADLWPRLRLLVTWTCGGASVALDGLRDDLPSGARVMELGYLCSEFRGTLTLGRRAASGMPTLETHFFEFAEREAWDHGDRELLTLDRVRKGREYYVVVTTPSGLYRYFINDIVRVTGFLHATPLLQFVQKGKGVTSITGEKLYEAQVLQAVLEALASIDRRSVFLMMVADEAAQGYRLYVETEGAARADAAGFAGDVDERLGRLNIEYAAKRESGRLGALAVRWLAPGTGEAFKQECVRRGQREGQFKTVALDYRRRVAFDLDAHAVA